MSLFIVFMLVALLCIFAILFIGVYIDYIHDYNDISEYGFNYHTTTQYFRTNLKFSDIKKLYKINPSKWDIRKIRLKTRPNTEMLIYMKSNKKFYIIKLSFIDFYRLWLAFDKYNKDMEKQKVSNEKREELNIKAALYEDVSADIEKMKQEAQTQIEAGIKNSSYYIKQILEGEK